MAEIAEMVISRKGAFALGLSRYNTGKPCKNGHLAWRNTVSRQCFRCNTENTHRQHLSNPGKTRARTSKWALNYPDRKAASVGAYTATRRSADCVAEEYSIHECIPFYAEARRLTKETGTAHHVDHIIPLVHGGKHTASNLQVLTALENIQKGALFVL